MSDSLNFVGISGSLRRQSRNSGLLRCAAKSLPDGITLTMAVIADLPLFSEDLENDKPEPVRRFLALAAEADALVLACPEYNYSMAPALKNALDWASREPGNAILNGKPVAILGAGGGMGTSRAQYHLRQTCVCLNLLPLPKPELFADAFSPSFDADGDVADEKLAGQVRGLMLALADWTRRLRGQAC